MFFGSKVNCIRFHNSGIVSSINNEEIKFVNQILDPGLYILTCVSKLETS